jgi:2,4-didehydro-3-deoxy-L-rhamnonate hydrolase
MKPPAVPLVFTKFPSCLADPADPVILGGSTDDYEAELVVVIGRGGRDIGPEDAWDHVGGLTAGQDISDRALITTTIEGIGTLTNPCRSSG